MLRFRLNEFEQLFSEASLEKGYRLGKRSRPVLLEKKGPHFLYDVAGAQITLHRGPEEVSNCHCSCGRNYCIHLAALMFSYLDDLSLKKRTHLRPSKASATVAEFRKVLAELRSILDSGMAKGDARRALSELTDECRLHRLHKSLASDLAVLAALSLPGRIALTDDKVDALTNAIILRHFGRSAPASDEELLYECLLELLRTNERVASGRANALLPVFLSACSNMFRIGELQNTIQKRHLRKFHTELFDELQIAKQMLHFRTQQLGGREVILAKSSSAESYVALARLHFAVQDFDRAWQILDELRVLTRETAPLCYFDLLSYLISLSGALRDPVRKRQYIEELMLYSPYLNGPLIQSFLALLAEREKPEAVRRLMLRIAETRAESMTDKIFALCMASGVTDVFLDLLQRSRIRFVMVHEVFMKYNHAFDTEQMALYFRKVCETLLSLDPGISKEATLDMGARMVAELGSGGKKFARFVGGFISDHALLRKYSVSWQRSLAAHGIGTAALSLQA